MGNWTRLLNELRFMPEEAPRYVTYGEDETKGAHERLMKSLAKGEQNAMAADILAKGKKATAALPRIKAQAKAFSANVADMMKSIRRD